MSATEPVAEAAHAIADAPEPARSRELRRRPSTDSIADGVRTRTTYAVSLDMFEGPLDLLLHLVRRHELDILDIPIAFITEKYIEYITFARSLDIEIAGEYLVMAATLAFLKSRELLPPAPGEAEEELDDEDDGVDPREELIRRLIEYERFREAGEELGVRPLVGRDVFPRGGDPDVVLPEPGLAPVTLFRLAEAYNRVLDRAKIREDHEVVIEAVTVRQRMRQLSLLLSREPRIGFEALFLTQVWSSERELRQMLVVTLMSVLEMVKLGLMGVHQAQGSDALELERVVEVEAMNEAVAVFREEGEEDEDLPELAAITPPDPVTPIAGEDSAAPGEDSAAPVEDSAAPVEDSAAPVAGAGQAEAEAAVEATEAARPEAELEVASPDPLDGEREAELEVEAEADRLDETPELAVADEPDVVEPDVVEPDVVEPEVETQTVAPDDGATE
jgi:segregation and condensation protein A